jgi:hypothetical protein
MGEGAMKVRKRIKSERAKLLRQWFELEKRIKSLRKLSAKTFNPNRALFKIKDIYEILVLNKNSKQTESVQFLDVFKIIK